MNCIRLLNRFRKEKNRIKYICLQKTKKALCETIKKDPNGILKGPHCKMYHGKEIMKPFFGKL